MLAIRPVFFANAMMVKAETQVPCVRVRRSIWDGWRRRRADWRADLKTNRSAQRKRWSKIKKAEGAVKPVIKKRKMSAEGRAKMAAAAKARWAKVKAAGKTKL